VYAELVGQAYHYASETVLRLLMEKNSLLDRLESVKHYFLGNAPPQPFNLAAKGYIIDRLETPAKEGRSSLFGKRIL
jgi:hypothetical protein